MKQLISILLFLLLSKFQLFSQIKISGYLLDAKKLPIPGGSVSIKNSYDGATSNNKGYFEFSTEDKGDQIIVANFIGFDPIEKTVKIGTENIVLEFMLKEKLNELKAVTISAGSIEAGDSKRTTVLKPLDIYTTAGSSGDVVGGLKTLPGAQQVGESEGLFIRGGAGYETKQFIDGMLVYNPFYSSTPDVATRGRFQPALFKGTTFSSGGYSAQYGQALSSVITLESIDIPDRSTLGFSVSPIGVSVDGNKLIKPEKLWVGGFFSYSNLAPYFNIIKQKFAPTKAPESYTGGAIFRFRPTPKTLVKYYGTLSTNVVGFERQNVDSANYKDEFSVNNVNTYHILTFKSLLNSKWALNGGVNFNYNEDKINNNSKATRSNNITSTNVSGQARLVASRRINTLSVWRIGTEIINGNDNFAIDTFSYAKPAARQFDKKIADNFVAAFSENEIYLSNNIVFRLGLRSEYSSFINKVNLAPRASLGIKVSEDGSLSFAYGEFFQKAERDQLFRNEKLDYTRSTHFVGTYQLLKEKRTFRIESFYKVYHNLVTQIPLAQAPFIQYENKGKGYATGAELFFRDKQTFKGFDYWVSYSFLDTKRQFLNYTSVMQPTFATPHTFVLRTNKFFAKAKTSVSATYSYSSGRPFYNLQPNFVSNNYELKEKGITQDLHTVNFSAAYLIQYKKMFGVIVFAVNNVLGNKQIYGYNFNAKGDKFEITNQAPRFFFVSGFFSFGIDRRQEAIDGN
jgi:vitamin B12 transporter